MQERALAFVAKLFRVCKWKMDLLFLTGYHFNTLLILNKVLLP